MSELAFKTAVELADAIRAKQVGCLELLDHYIDRVERHNPALNALVVKDYDNARKRAREADAALARGETWGPLHGVPMSIKESYNVAGQPTTWGVPDFADHIAKSDAVAVERLKNAGVTLFGKTNVPLYLGDFQSYNDVYGTTNNPWDVTRTPGGSSGGSAAMLAAGLTGLDAGSDIGGSIRNPAHYSGVYGLKPTWGILPLRGHSLLDTVTPADISVIGPLARGPEDLAVALDVMAGADGPDANGWRLDLAAPRGASLKDYRIAVWLDQDIAAVDTEVTDCLSAAVDAMAKAGATIDDKARPEIDPVRALAVYRQLLYAVITARRPQEAFDEALAEAAGLADDDNSPRAQLLRATTLHHRQWLALNEERNQMRWRWVEFFKDYDALICPISATSAFPHDHDADMDGRTITVNGKSVAYFDQIFWAGLFGVAHLPATVAPVGPGASGLPVGMQIVGPHLGDRTTIEIARLLAQEIGGFTPPPGYD